MSDLEKYAFPVKEEWAGLTKREYFAAAALTGILVRTFGLETARYAVQYADALIAELAKEPTS